MSAIPAASVSLKTMADGTLRMTFDIEPAQAKDAFSLFASPGTPVAIAALQVGYAAKSDAGIPASEKEPIGPLCKWLVMRCAEPEFWAWINSESRGARGGVFWHVKSEAEAREFVCSHLMIDSRKEIDADPKTAQAFHELIRQPYQKWLVRRSA